MKFHRKLRVLAATVTVAAVAAPVAGAARPGGLVQIGGELVAPAQLSSWQAHAGQSHSPRLVQIGGAFVAPEKLSSWQASQGKVSSVSTALPTSDSGFGWNDAGVGFGLALGAMLFVAAAMYVRRTRTASPC